MGNKTRVLLIDDNVNFVRLTTQALEAAGYEVEAAYNSDEGFTKVEFGKPDIIVLDLMMERHDSGFKLAKRIKDHPAYKDTPILMLTAVGEATGFRFSLEKDGYWMKTDDFAEKPVPPDELARRIEKLLTACREKS